MASESATNPISEDLNFKPIPGEDTTNPPPPPYRGGGELTNSVL